MMAFCGHDLDCSLFNSKEVMQRAKANVEKFYPVVGVLENLNKSLSVMEKLLPNIFKGATQVDWPKSSFNPLGKLTYWLLRSFLALPQSQGGKEVPESQCI